MKVSYYLIILIVLATFVEFYGLGDQTLMEYDEARYAVNASEMMQNGDYINLHYQGKPDTWVARPPLKAWCIIAGYHLLGFNEWGLRFSSGIAILVFITFAFLFFKEFFQPFYAFLGCLMLIFSKGVIGFHVGRNGDMDAELIALLAAFSYTFVRYLNTNRVLYINVSVLMLGVAFYLKTTACFIYLPGIFLFLLLSGRLKSFLKSKHIWFSAALFAVIILSWFVILQWKGVSYPPQAGGYHSNENSWQTMILYDTWQRFTASSFDGHPVETNRAFFILSLDSVFTPWNYLFYAGVVLMIWFLIKAETRRAFKQSAVFQALLLATGVLIPVSILLTFGMHKLSWYTSPALLYTSIPALFFLHFLFEKIAWSKYVVLPLIGAACCLYFFKLQKVAQVSNQITFIREHQQLWNAHPVIYTGRSIPQNVYAYCLWEQKSLTIADSLPADPAGLYWINLKADSLDESRFTVLAKSNPDVHAGSFVLAVSKK